jgi:hypothetical protein
MRAAEFLAKSLLEAAQAAMVIHGEGLPPDGLYFNANSDEALIKTVKTRIGSLFREYAGRKSFIDWFPQRVTLDLDDFANVLLKLGYSSVVRGENSQGVQVYGSPNLTSRNVRLLGVDPDTAVDARSQAWGKPASGVAGNVLKNVGAPRKRSYIGATIASDAQRPGARVTEVEPNGPAAQAGVRAGDVIVGGGFVQGRVGPNNQFVPRQQSPLVNINSSEDYAKFIRKWDNTAYIQLIVDRNGKIDPTRPFLPMPGGPNKV